MVEAYRLFTLAPQETLVEKETTQMMINTRKAFERTYHKYKKHVEEITGKIHARRKYIDFMDLYTANIQDSYHLNEVFDGINSPYLPLNSRPICLACESGSHECLMQCPLMTTYIPSQNGANKALPEGIYKICLMSDANQCTWHTCLREATYICERTKIHKLICECAEHGRLHRHILGTSYPAEGSLYIRVYLRKYFKNKHRMIGNHFWPL